MRIGITTWHTGTNPGTFFQVFGLYKFLTDRRGEVKVIDYKQTEKSDLLPRGLRYYLSNFIAVCKLSLSARSGLPSQKSSRHNERNSRRNTSVSMVRWR